jgi:hypothetical protein
MDKGRKLILSEHRFRREKSSAGNYRPSSSDYRPLFLRYGRRVTSASRILVINLATKLYLSRWRELLYILRWREAEGLSGAEHAEEPAVCCGAAFIPHLMEQHKRDEGQLGDNEMFV